MIVSICFCIADEIKIDNQIVMEGEEFCFKYRQIISNANCYVKLGNEAMSSDELQDGRNLTLVSGENWCTMCIINFKLESIFRHLAAESNYIRTIDEVFGVILMEKLSGMCKFVYFFPFGLVLVS